MSFDFPVHVRSQRWWLVQNDYTAGRSFAGTEPMVSSLLEQWRCEITLKIGPDEAPAWNAWQAERRGRKVPFDLGPVTHWAGATAAGGYDSGATYADGASFGQGAELAASAAALATRLVIDGKGASGALAQGWNIGLAGRLHRITRQVTVSGDDVTVDIQPPLRAAASVGDPLEYPPTAPMRLLADDAGALDHVYTGDLEVTLSMVEVL